MKTTTINRLIHLVIILTIININSFNNRDYFTSKQLDCNHMRIFGRIFPLGDN